eukprot:790851-Pyramimonas_sp.AAC.1
MGLAHLVEKFPADLSDEHRNAIVSDWGAATGYIEMGLRMKLACWSQLPWKLAGICHHDPTVRRDIAQDVLRQYDSSVEAGFDDDTHHQLSVKYLSPDGFINRYRRH